MIDIPIRYYRDYAGAYDYGYEKLGLPLDECALLVVDVDGTSPNPTTEGMIVVTTEGTIVVTTGAMG